MTQDRTGSEVLQFTHEFLVEMLGAQRTTVTIIAGGFQRRSLIKYSRGKVGSELVDRLGVGVDNGAHLNAPSSLSGRPATGGSVEPIRADSVDHRKAS